MRLGEHIPLNIPTALAVLCIVFFFLCVGSSMPVMQKHKCSVEKMHGSRLLATGGLLACHERLGDGLVLKTVLGLYHRNGTKQVVLGNAEIRIVHDIHMMILLRPGMKSIQGTRPESQLEVVIPLAFKVRKHTIQRKGCQQGIVFS